LGVERASCRPACRRTWGLTKNEEECHDEDSVNDDGTGHADCIVTGAPDEHFDFVIVSKGDEAYFTAVPATVPGAGTTTIRGLAKSQR